MIQFVDLSLDAMDSAGDQHLHIEHNIYKRRVDLNGNPIEESKKEEILTSTSKKENIVRIKFIQNHSISIRYNSFFHVIQTQKLNELQNRSVSICGDCYGAKQNDTHCCNTCQDVINAYREKHWNPNTDDFEQCKRENYVDKDNEAKKLALNEGCQIYGYMEVNRVR